MDLHFLGATGTVTGSKYLLRHSSRQYLIDCGLFQGFKQLRLRNWEQLPVDPRTIDAVILTHAHLDHSGYLPLLVRNGFKGKVYCTPATRDLCGILLPDSGHLQEEEVEYANRRGFSRHKPALPLYTQADAEHCLKLFSPVEYGIEWSLGDIIAQFLPSGHILGAAFVSLRNADTSIVFSGDIGRPNDIVMPAPVTIPQADYLVVESTYGNRRHDPSDPKIKLAEVINRAAARQGVIVIPSFAVGRAQELLYYVHLLKTHKTIPDIPVFLNSPMAVTATQIFHNHPGEHRLTPSQCDAMCKTAHIVNSVEESKLLNQKQGPMIIISASGMATGGRVVHHLKAFAPDPRNAILFAGFQAGGTRGAAIVDGAETVKIHGEHIPVRAEIALMDNLSAHADAGEIMTWLRCFKAPPRRTFVTHGEPLAADALRHRIEEELAWECRVPDYLERAQLDQTMGHAAR